jgi:acetyltransferase-like isoleucine patch superfamily enzyme
VAKVAEAAPPELTLRDVDERFAEVHPTAVVSSLAVVGSPGEWHDHPSRFPAIIGENVIVRELARVHAGCERATSIGAGSLIMSGAHIGHDAQLGLLCDVAPNAVVGGLVTIGDNVKIGMGVMIRPGVTIGDNVRIGAGAVVTKDIPSGGTWVGNPARLFLQWRGGKIT